MKSFLVMSITFLILAACETTKIEKLENNLYMISKNGCGGVVTPAWDPKEKAITVCPDGFDLVHTDKPDFLTRLVYEYNVCKYLIRCH